MSRAPLIVLKLGSSVLRSDADLPCAAGSVAGWVAAGWRVLAVVSAVGNGTDELIRKARKRVPSLGDASPGVGPEGQFNLEAAYAALLATGEAASAALLSLTLGEVGIESTVLDAGRVGPFTRGPQLDAMPHALDAGTVRRLLDRRPVAVLPGFVGRDVDGRHTLLGRGGSDLTALFAAHTLGAERCRLLKDVDGIYEHDPALRGRRRPRRYAALDWEGALRLDDCILQRKATQFAYRHRVRFEVGCCGSNEATLVGEPTTRFSAGRATAKSRRARSGAAACTALAAQGGLAS